MSSIADGLFFRIDCCTSMIQSWICTTTETGLAVVTAICRVLDLRHDSASCLLVPVLVPGTGAGGRSVIF
jgi:hypothetical protein